MSTPAKNDRVISLKESDALNALPAIQVNPQALLARAIESGATVETLERLVTLAKDIRQVTAREAYFESMAKFKSRCPRIKKDATANAGQYSYKYATLDGILDVVDRLLGEVGLTISWKQKHEGNAVHASCVITHRLGHQEESGFIAIPFDAAGRMNPAQRVGSAATYAKRYSLLAILGMAPEDDDDAQSTQTTPGVRKPAREPDVTEVAEAEHSAHEMSLESESKTLFPDPQADVERERLLNDVRKIRDAITANIAPIKGRLAAWEKEQIDAWETYVGAGVSPSQADPAALADLKKWLETRQAK